MSNKKRRHFKHNFRVALLFIIRITMTSWYLQVSQTSISNCHLFYQFAVGTGIMLLSCLLISVKIALLLGFQPPLPRCKENEIMKKYGCDKTCDQNEQCHTNHCFCVEGFFRQRNGKCVPATECSISDTTKTTQYLMECGINQTYKSCEPCERTCVEPNPVCVKTCVDDNSTCVTACLTGCFCEEGYFKAPDGKCVRLYDCPEAEVMSIDNEPSIEECQQDEVFVWCGWCEATCSQPSPECPPDVCTRGCLCRPPLLRHRSGHCVDKRDCFRRTHTPIYTCHGRNEEYVCRYGCEPSCERKACFRESRCSLGCHCKFGLLRDRDGTCVTADKCQINITTPPLKF